MSYFDLPPILEKMLSVAENISDLNFSVGRPPQVEINGKLTPVDIKGLRTLTPYQTEIIAMALLEGNFDGAERLVQTGSADISYSLPSRTRFRVNIFKQRGSISVVMRVIPMYVPTIKSLNLPPQLGEVSHLKNGIVLLTGPTGSGKSSTLAAVIDKINTEYSYHIVTIEDPIEFLHRDKKSYVNQREVDVDTRSFSEALRGALRQDPDVILVGEMRDYETIETALTAAETGHLVLSTLHTLDATETVNRIVSVFPPHQQRAIRLQLASVLKAVVSMRLVRAAESIQGRVPAVEVMVVTPYIRDCVIHAEKTSMIREAIAQGTSQYGMQTFDQSLFDLYTRGLITYEEALGCATNADEFKLRVSGVRSVADQAREDMERVRKRTGPLDATKPETKQFVNWLLEGTEQVTR